MRFEKSIRFVELARRLAASAEGLTLDEMAGIIQADRRTAERMRDALRSVFPQMEELPEGKTKRFRISGGLDGFIQDPTPEELTELQAAILDLDAKGGGTRAALLKSLEAKVRGKLRASVKHRIATDVDALANATGHVMQAGPKPIVEPQTLANIRVAIKSLHTCVFTYSSKALPEGKRRNVIPYGLLFGRDYYLLGHETGKPAPVLWRLDRITDLKVGDPCDGSPEDFNLTAYAARSFGTFQEPAEDVVLRFVPAAADDARRYLFHPSQIIEDQTDGGLVVRFHAGGMLELAWHLFTWGDQVEIVAPDTLRSLMTEQLENALRSHSRTSSATGST